MDIESMNEHELTGFIPPAASLWTFAHLAQSMQALKNGAQVLPMADLESTSIADDLQRALGDDPQIQERQFVQEKVDVKESWIPANRLDDFIWGENMRENFHTQFGIGFIQACKVNRDGPLEKTVTWYTCCFGPKDYRHLKQDYVPNQLKSKEVGVFLKKKTLTGASIKCGCQCSFSATKFEDRPRAVLICWIHREHLDRNNGICHGLLEKTAYASNCHLAPHISLKLRAKIERYLRAGMSAKAIIRVQFEEVSARWRQDHPDEDSHAVFSRDMQLTSKDIWTVREAMRRRQPFYTNDDATTIKMWALQNLDQVLIYQPQIKSEDQPFILLWSTPWQQKKLATLGHGNAVAFDATFGTNHFGVIFQNAIPVAFALLQTYKALQVSQVLTAVKEAANAKRHELNLELPWTPTCWIIEVVVEEQIAISQVFPNVPIMFCSWHVRRAWTKNIISKVLCPFAKAQINVELGTIMYSQGPDLNAESKAFMNRWRDSQPVFVAYYKKEWHQKVLQWAVNVRNYKHANQNTNGGDEHWHHTLKVELKMDKSSIMGRSIPWLIEHLKLIENHYWYVSAVKFQGRIWNRTIEQLFHKCIVRAKAIPDDYVSTFECGTLRYADVQSVSQKNVGLKSHIVIEYDKDSCSCTCGYSMQGNACKHQIKVLLMTRMMTEMELLIQLGAKFGTMCGGLDHHFNIKDGDDDSVSPLANVAIVYDGEEFWDEPPPTGGCSYGIPKTGRVLGNASKMLPEDLLSPNTGNTGFEGIKRMV